MTNQARRVAVTGPGTAPPGAVRPVLPGLSPERLAAARRIRRAQLRRAVVVLLLAGVLLAGLPVLIDTVPGLVTARLFGVPGAWLAVAVLPYPLLAGLAWAGLRSAERAERAELPERDRG